MEAFMPRQVDFKKLAEEIDITAVAQQLGLALKLSGKDLRTACPACQTDDARSLAVIPNTNSFRCYAASKSGDCVSLWAHIRGIGNYKAAIELEELFKAPESLSGTTPSTSPQKPGGSPSSPPASTAAAPAPKGPGPFDPDAYLAKLQFTDEVAALGISEEDAQGLGIGYSSAGLHKGIAFALRWPDGTIAGFASVIGGQVKLPKRLIPRKVVQLRRA
jgi:CHC2 zinc finger